MDVSATICDACKRRDAFIFRQYSGERLCRRCFVRSVEEKVRATISRYKMLKFDDRIAVAVSGGKDSVSLLHIMAKRERRFPRASLTAITVDEGIKGYRNEALEIAAENCRKLNVKHHIVSFNHIYGWTLDELVKRLRDGAERGLTPCACCGVLRRKALNLAAREVGATKIATAHTLDDETQTILLNIFHGDVLRIAREKPVTDRVHPRLVQRIKPFCEIPERETAMFAYVKKIKLQSRPCPYASEALRNDVRNMLNSIERKHAGTQFTIFRSMERIRPALEEIDKKQRLTECSECGETTSEKICRTCQMLAQITLPR